MQLALGRLSRRGAVGRVAGDAGGPRRGGTGAGERGSEREGWAADGRVGVRSASCVGAGIFLFDFACGRCYGARIPERFPVLVRKRSW